MDATKTLRDELAMAALQVCANGLLQPDRRDRDRTAKIAYAWADSMLAAREIKPEQLIEQVR